MKNIYLKITAVAVSGILASGCLSFLTENPTTKLTYESIFNSEQSVEAQVNGLYEGLYAYAAEAVSTLEFSSHLVHWKSTSRSGLQYEQYLRGTLFETQSQCRGILTDMYSSIYDCCLLLDGLSGCQLNEEFKKEIEAETKFLRAFYYFHLVRVFGDVPIFRKAPAGPEDYNISRNSFIDVYKYILEDLDFAEKNMRTAQKQLSATGHPDRASKYTAIALKAIVYNQIASLLSSPDDQGFGTLASGEVKPDFKSCGIADEDAAWKLSLDAADKVIAEGGYELEPDYRHLFRWDILEHPEDYSSKERILTVQFTSNCGRNNTLSTYSLPPYFYGTSNYTENPSMYSQRNPSRFVFQKWAATYGGDKGTTTASQNTYINCRDPRFDATYIYGNWRQYRDAKGNLPAEDYGLDYIVQFGYPSYGGETVDGKANKTNFINGNNYDYFPHFRKYFSTMFKQDAGYSGFYAIRLAEMYLLAAEASAELGQNGQLGDAYAYVEKIHERARNSVDGAPAEQPKWTAGQFGYGQELIDAIMWERIYELSDEGHEWFDTHRRGAAWLLRNVNIPLDKFLNEPEQAEYKLLYWYGDKNYELPLSLHNVRCGLLCEYPEYELMHNTALSRENDQNFFNQTKADFKTGQGSAQNGEGNNSNFDDNEEDFNW